ncbi:hypothetical protein B0H14DRAFT_3106026 [Mycena olivaceomarginata]|nr:hypothetical protein B0H14DRAFT_3106026 [Mycena olivaceomarginata]
MRVSGVSLGLGLLRHVAQANQTPFHLAPSTTDAISAPTFQWTDLAARPHANATSQLIFDNVNSISQHWTHTRYRNGHSIIPGTVPVGTLLYHGRDSEELPTFPEWTSTDPEHSFPFCGDRESNGTITGCWHLTLVATRPLKVLYFDGSSASNIKDGGTLDIQDLLVWGKVDPTRWLDERARINALCAWGKEFGLDGFFRMEMDFEIMLCDFSQGVELVSTDYLASWWARHVTPPLWRPTERSAVRSSLLSSNDSLAANVLIFEAVRAGSWHNNYPGESRIVIDLTGFISLYDTTLAPSLVPLRQQLERWDHRTARISATDLTALRIRLNEGPYPGVDWRTLYRVVLERYAERLELTEYLLNTTTPHNVDERVRQVQTQLRVMLTPYILYTSRPSPRSISASVNESWALPVWQGCATRHTGHIHASKTLQSRLTTSERLLLRALDETNREICRVIVRMWAAGVHAGLDSLIPPEENKPAADPLLIVQGWRSEASALIQWLDWGVWVKCRPACGVEEMCYLPTWPFFWDMMLDPEGKDERWKRPQPRCVRQFEPYSKL